MRNIGEMKHRIKLFKRVIDDSSGSSVEALEPIFEARAAVWNVSGREFATSVNVVEETRLIFTIRQPCEVALNSGLVVEYSGRMYDVVELVANSRWRRMLDLRAISKRMEGSGYGL